MFEESGEGKKHKQTQQIGRNDFAGWLVCCKKHLRLIFQLWGSTWKCALEDEKCLFSDTRSSSLTRRVLPRGKAAFSCSVSLWVRLSQTVYRPNTMASPAGNTKGCRATERHRPHLHLVFPEDESCFLGQRSRSVVCTDRGFITHIWLSTQKNTSLEASVLWVYTLLLFLS